MKSEEEFDLSEGRGFARIEDLMKTEIARTSTPVYCEEDVKEFIKTVEEDYEKEWDKAADECRIIDKNKLKEIIKKRAGEKLR